MLAEFSIIPIGAGSSIGDRLAEVLRIVDASGIPYKINPMGTVVEGEWDEVIRLIKKCHKTVMKTGERAVTTISIDDRKGKPNRIEEKVKSIERRIGKSLKKIMGTELSLKCALYKFFFVLPRFYAASQSFFKELPEESSNRPGPGGIPIFFKSFPLRMVFTFLNSVRYWILPPVFACLC